MELYLSLSAYGGVSTREALTVFWGAGIRHVELAIGPLPDTDAVQAIQDFRQQGMVYRAHHAFVWGSCHYPFNLARSQDWDYFERLTDFLAYGGITAYERAWWEFSNSSAIAPKPMQHFSRPVHCLHHMSQTRGIVLGVETMYPTLPTSTLREQDWTMPRKLPSFAKMPLKSR